MNLLFVYGSLKRGLNNAFYLQDARFLGAFTTEPVYSMYSFGTYPAVSESGNTPIEGEVYEISDAQLAMTDRLEWYPDFYQRLMIDTNYGKAWMYVVSEQLCADKVRIGGNWLIKGVPV